MTGGALLPRTHTPSSVAGGGLWRIAQRGLTTRGTRGGPCLCGYSSLQGADRPFLGCGCLPQVSFCAMVYPCLVLTYLGQAAYLMAHPEAYTGGVWGCCSARVQRSLCPRPASRGQVLCLLRAACEQQAVSVCLCLSVTHVEAHLGNVRARLTPLPPLLSVTTPLRRPVLALSTQGLVLANAGGGHCCQRCS